MASTPVGTDRSLSSNYIFQSNSAAECLTGGSLAALVVYDRFFNTYAVASLNRTLTNADPYLEVSLWASDLAGVVSNGGAIESWSGQAGQPLSGSRPVYHASGGYNGGSYVKASYTACQTGQYLQLLKNPLVLNMGTNGGLTIGVLMRWDSLNSLGNDRIIDFGNGIVDWVVLYRW